jgi:acetyltransferase-like isoleucine patch superfamily enzyme
MNTKKGRFRSQWSYWQEALVFALVTWVPLSPGKTLRRLAYRTVFARIGTSVQIEPGAEFVGAEHIVIGDKVHISRDVRIRSFGNNSEVRIANHVQFDRGVDIKIHHNGEVEIGEHTYIGPYTCLSGNYIKIGKDCLIASHSGIYANNHGFSDLLCKIREQQSTYKGIVIEDNCWLGSGVRVVDGVTIGEGSVIGAGAVVTKNIPPYSIAVGVPAKVVSRRNVFQETLVKAEVG